MLVRQWEGLEVPGRSDAREGRGERHLLGGIDEAGLGPLLGPLVVAGTVLSGPAGLSPWKQLASVFCRKPRSRRDRRVRVDDSKKVKTGSRGLAELERTALCLHYATHRSLPADLASFLSPALRGSDLAGYPWYGELEQVPLPRWNDRRSVELDAHLALNGMAKAGIHSELCVFHPVLVGSFNRLIDEHDNKSLAHFASSLPVLRACLATQGQRGAELKLVVDRHGAREHYHSLLERALPGRELRILHEGRRTSRYRLGATSEILFTENGEARAFPTAAASCLAKYVRELFVERLNAWFLARRPGLRPTAGYYKDGRRFLEDIAPLRSRLPMELLVRCR